MKSRVGRVKKPLGHLALSKDNSPSASDTVCLQYVLGLCAGDLVGKSGMAFPLAYPGLIFHLLL
jgi:hypothetical protein